LRRTLATSLGPSKGNTSEVVRAGLRLLEREEKALQALRAAIDEGLNSPESEDVDGEEFMAQLISSVERPA